MNRLKLMCCALAISQFYCASTVMGAEAIASQFLRFLYGDAVDVTNICHPHEDLWMLPGAKNTNALRAVAAIKFDPANTNGVVSGVIPQRNMNDLYFVELRNGKVDPAINLDGVYQLHRQKILMLLYGALIRSRERMADVVTDPMNVEIIGKKAAPGDMDVYSDVLSSMPLVRHSKPADDFKTRTVSYRVPLSDTSIVFTLLKQGSTWKVDTSKPIKLPLEYFFREEEGPRQRF
jgi:hypothetical protein